LCRHAWSTSPRARLAVGMLGVGVEMEMEVVPMRGLGLVELNRICAQLPAFGGGDEAARNFCSPMNRVGSLASWCQQSPGGCSKQR